MDTQNLNAIIYSTTFILPYKIEMSKENVPMYSLKLNQNKLRFVVINNPVCWIHAYNLGRAKNAAHLGCMLSTPQTKQKTLQFAFFDHYAYVLDSFPLFLECWGYFLLANTYFQCDLSTLLHMFLARVDFGYWLHIKCQER